MPDPTPGPSVKIRGTDTYGRPIWASDKWWALWEGMRYNLPAKLSNKLAIAQGPWQERNGGGAPASAGYHDFEGPGDLSVRSLNLIEQMAVVEYLRFGTGAPTWIRDARHNMVPHIHWSWMCWDSSRFAYGTWLQWLDYLAGGNGLSGTAHGPDYHKRPANPAELRYPPEEMFMLTASEIANAMRPVIAEEIAKQLAGVPQQVWDHKLKVHLDTRTIRAGNMQAQTHHRTGTLLNIARQDESVPKAARALIAASLEEPVE